MNSNPHAPMHPIPPAFDANGNTISYPNPGISQRLYVATELMKAMIAVAPWQVISRDDVAKEAYLLADTLIDNQYTHFTP